MLLVVHQPHLTAFCQPRRRFIAGDIGRAFEPPPPIVSESSETVTGRPLTATWDPTGGSRNLPVDNGSHFGFVCVAVVITTKAKRNKRLLLRSGVREMWSEVRLSLSRFHISGTAHQKIRPDGSHLSPTHKSIPVRLQTGGWLKIPCLWWRIGPSENVTWRRVVTKEGRSRALQNPYANELQRTLTVEDTGEASICCIPSTDPPHLRLLDRREIRGGQHATKAYSVSALSGIN